MLSAALLTVPSALDAQPAAWGQPAWAHRMEFTARADSVPPSGTLTDFPLLLSLDAAQAQVFSRAKMDGSDLLVTAGDGTTVLDREIVGYDASAMEAEIWIRAGALSQADRRFYLYYDHPGTTLAAAPPGAWSPPYRAVYHFDDDPGGGVLTDSSPAGADIALLGSQGWTSSDTTRAQIRQGWFLNGTTHHLATKSISTQDSSYVISMWLLNVESAVDFALQANPDYWHISSQVNSTAPQPDYALSTGYVRWYPRPIPLNAGYHLFTWVFNAAAHNVQFFYDGEPQNVYLGSTYYGGRQINPQENVPVGVLGPIYYNSEDVMKGGADEFRIREGVVSADWIRTEYRNQRDPQGFYDFGSEEVRDVTAVGPRPDPAAGLFLAQNTPNPFQSRTAFRFSLEAAGTVRLAVYSVTGRRIADLIEEPLGPGTYEATWDGRTRAGLRAPSGVYFLRLEMNGAARTVKLQLRR
jgi:hypothetical protein